MALQCEVLYSTIPIVHQVNTLGKVVVAQTLPKSLRRFNR